MFIFRKFLKKYFPTSISRIVFIIFILALWIRFLGVYPGFPPNHPDEPTVYGSVSRIILHGDFKPVLYSYGGLLSQLYAFLVIVFFLPFYFLREIMMNFNTLLDRGLVPFIDNFRHSQLISGYNFLYWSRYLTSILGALTVIIIYKLGKNLFNKWVGLLAAFFVAVNYRLVLSSVFALADTPAAFFASLSVLLSLNLIKNRSAKSYLLAGLGLALALSVKFFVYVIPAFFLCHALGILGKKNTSFVKKISLILFYRDLFLSLLVCLTAFFIINPYILFDFHTFYTEYQYDSRRFGVTDPIQQLLNYNYHKSLLPLYYLVRYSLGESLTIAIAIGFLYSLIRKFKSTLILSSVALPFLVVFLLIAAPSSPRYYSAIVPLLLLFPAFLIIDVSGIVRARSIRFLLIILAVAIIGYQSLKDSYLTSLYFSSEQNQVSSMRWLEANIPNGSIIASSAAFLPLDKNLIEIDINPVGPTHLMSMSELADNQVQWVVVSSHFTSSVNSQFWVSSNLVEKTFFNDKLFWELIDNTYATLVLKEVGAYRVKEFIKPFWQSPDRAIFIAKMPKLWKIKKDRLVLNYKFNEEKESELAREYSCGPKTSVFSKTFPAEQNKWYSFLGNIKRQATPSHEGQRNGFLRLDFYSEKNKTIKTYVSSLVNSGAKWQELTAAGISPALTKYGRISFQLDQCFLSEKYLMGNLEVFLSDDFSQIDKTEFPFYDKDLPRNFLWLPEL